MKANQKFRIIVSGVTLFDLTRKQVLKMLGGNQFYAVESAFNALQRMIDAGDPAVGLAGNWHGVSVQVDKV